MKLINFVILLLCVFVFSTGCKKDSNTKNAYKCTSCTTTPEANAVNDASTKGIYKGIVIGSTGTVKFDIQNGSTAIKAYLTIDGTSVELVSDISWDGTESYVAPFTGTLNGQSVAIVFSVGFNGSDPFVASANIPGHPNAEFTIAKETSTSLIECYEGTYHTTKPQDGTFNILLSRTIKKWGGIARDNGATEADDVNGTIVNNQLIDEDGTNLATLSNDEISGSFKDDDGKTVTIKGKRTL